MKSLSNRRERDQALGEGAIYITYVYAMHARHSWHAIMANYAMVCMKQTKNLAAYTYVPTLEPRLVAVAALLFMPVCTTLYAQPVHRHRG